MYLRNPRQGSQKHLIINPATFRGAPPKLEPMLHPHRYDVQIDAPSVAPSHPFIRQRAEGRARARRIQSPGIPLRMWHDEVCLDGLMTLVAVDQWRVVDCRSQ